MSKVKISRDLAREINILKSRNYSDFDVLKRIVNGTSSYNFHDIWNTDIITVSRAISEGYELDKEYLSLEQVFELKYGTTIKHDDCADVFEIRNKDIVYKDTFLNLGLRKWAISPRWYVVE